MNIMTLLIGLMLFYVIPSGILLVAGKSIWDKLLGMNLVATKVIIIIVAVASVYNRTFLLDLAIVYALSGFIGTIFIALYLLDRYRGGKGGNQ